MLQAGSPSPDFRLAGLAGGELGLPDVLARGPAVLAFFKVSCPTCQLAFPFLERLAQGSLRFLAVSQDDAKNTERFRQHLGITFETLLDPAAEGYPASRAFGLTNVPSLFLLEPDGRVSFTSVGFSRADLEALGQRAGIVPFGPADHVPAWKAG